MRNQKFQSLSTAEAGYEDQWYLLRLLGDRGKHQMLHNQESPDKMVKQNWRGVCRKSLSVSTHSDPYPTKVRFSKRMLKRTQPYKRSVWGSSHINAISNVFKLSYFSLFCLFINYFFFKTSTVFLWIRLTRKSRWQHEGIKAFLTFWEHY